MRKARKKQVREVRSKNSIYPLYPQYSIAKRSRYYGYRGCENMRRPIYIPMSEEMLFSILISIIRIIVSI